MPDREFPPPDVIACGANPNVKYCPDCIDAYRNGIEPGETACDERARMVLTVEITLPDGTVIRWAQSETDNKTIDRLTDAVESVIGSPDTIVC